MKKIVAINTCNFASTGNVMMGICECAREYGYETMAYSAHTRLNLFNTVKMNGHRYIGTSLERFVSVFINRITGNNDSLNIIGTTKMLREIDRFKPDIIHCHNLHSNFVNLEMLFNYIKQNNIKLVWTLHDCWPFTGHCPHFGMYGCYKWKTHCHDCPAYRMYPKTLRDNSYNMYDKKKAIFTGVKNAVIVAPSQWLADLAKQSYLKEYPIKVIPNGIDLETFRPCNSDFRTRYNLEDKFIILGVASIWGETKGKDRMENLAEQLGDEYKVVMTGIEATQVNSDKILSIPKINDPQQLAEIYSAADVFYNPTRQDTFPTVNIEALACGTPILSHGAGGSGEAFEEHSGIVVNDDNIIEVLDRLKQSNFDSVSCVARGRTFDRKEKFKEYIELYERI